MQRENALLKEAIASSHNFVLNTPITEMMRTLADQLAKLEQADVALRELQQRQLMAIEAGQVGFWDWDIADNRVEWSEMLYSFHGLDEGSFGGTVEDFAKLIHPADAEAVHAAISRALEEGSPYHIDFRALGPDGRIRWLSTNGRVIFDEHGKAARMMGATTDITDRKASEEALVKANQELRRANDDLNQFAYSASHDLQEPLRNITIYTQLLQRNCAGKLDAKTDDLMNSVVGGARRMESLIRDLLSYTRVLDITPGQVSPASCNAALRNAHVSLVNQIEQAGATVHTANLPDVRVHPAHLQQLFQNLLSNAIKYAKPGVPPEIHIECAPLDRFWRILIRDNGIGIDPQYAQTIFGVFRRLHSPDKYPGTGIGLAICQRIVDRYGGRIYVDSAPDEGACFVFTLPAV